MREYDGRTSMWHHDKCTIYPICSESQICLLRKYMPKIEVCYYNFRYVTGTSQRAEYVEQFFASSSALDLRNVEKTVLIEVKTAIQ